MQYQEVSLDDLVGQTLGTCHVEQLLGQNRVSAVYLAQQPEQQRTVAITLFRVPEQFPPLACDRFISRFLSHAPALVLLNHPNLLPIYEYGNEFGYPYLVTPYVTDGSLANLLKQQKQCTLAYTLEVLEQVAAGLDYAHDRGIIHGALKPSYLLLRNQHRVQVAGFGLLHILEMRGIDPGEHAYPELAHLLSIIGTFLGAPEYMAPEVVLGQPVDARSDIYALGIILFEMLSGKPPFSGTNPFEVAMQHVEQPIPSLHSLCPTVSEDLEHVIFRALHRDPMQRYQHASELVSAFAQALKHMPQAASTVTTTSVQEAASTHLLSANTLDEETTSKGKWQLVPPIVTGRLPVVGASMPEAVPIDSQTPSTLNPPAWQILPPIVTGSLPAVHLASPPRGDLTPQTLPADSSRDGNAPSLTPSEESSTVSSKGTEAHAPLPPQENSEMDTSNPQPETTRPKRSPSSRKRRYAAMSRRHAVALLATGGIVTIGAITVGGISLAHLLGNNAHPQSSVASTSAPSTHVPRPPHGTPTIGKPTQNPSHTGTVIGNTNQPVNSAGAFNNPLDGKASLLVHLPNNNFAAFEKACTHEGVPVYYDPGTHTLVCPAHGSVFDPANGGKVLQGPANKPLPAVTIRVNADGTITTG